MFWWLLLGNSRALRINQSLRMRQRPQMQGPAINSGLPREHPIEFARTPDGYMYFATGLDEVTKWDGLTPQVEISGVLGPTTGPTLTFSGTDGAITGDYQAYVRFLDAAGNVSNLSPAPTEVVTADEATTANYSNVPVPTEGNVTTRQILRNTAGQFLVFYVDIETNNLFETEFSSTRTDEDLRLQEPVALFDSDLNLNIANFHDVPPDDKPYISFYQNRLWLYGFIEYSEGNAQVTTGSTTVTIIGGRITDEFVDRLLYVDESDRSYLITDVDEVAQTLTIDSAYAGATDLWASYTVTPNRNRRHLLCYSEPGQFDSWRSEQNITIASSDDIDDVGTGLVSTQSFLFILQRRHIYRLTYFRDPTIDGGIFLSARRGCVNNRCWISVDGFIYMLDDRGVYKFNGGDDVEEVTPPIQDIFYFDRPEGERRINWDAARLFHANHDRNDATLRWFVAFSGSKIPRHAICYNYVTPQWWIEEYPWPIGDSSLLKGVNPIPVTASEAHRTFAVGIGTLDNLDQADGDTLVQATSGGIRSITIDTDYTLPGDLDGVPIGITAGKGKHQTRNIVSVSGQEIFVDRPWDIKPDATSWARIGAIPYRWRSHWLRWNPTETEETRRITLSYRPSPDATVDLRLFEDYSEDPTTQHLTWPINENAGSGVTTEKDDPNAVMDLSLDKGFSYLSLDSMREYGVWRKEVFAAELRGYSADKAVRVYAIDVEGANAQRRSQQRPQQ